MLKALLFDLDGTLANTDPIHFETWRELLLDQGLDISLDFYQTNFSGRRNQEIVKDLLPHLSDVAGEQLSWQKEANFRDRAEQVLVSTPGLAELLAWAAQHNLKQAVVTNAPVENARFMLQVLQLEATFPVVILGDELPKGKPDPLPYQLALEQLGVSAAETIAFEDSPSGIRSSRGAGIPTVGIASTHSPAELYDLGVSLVIADFTDKQLWKWLKRDRMLGPFEVAIGHSE
jgi:HAD superfamily hydrolase (TIGR01509 family)